MKSFWFYLQQSFMLIVLRRLRNFPMLLLLAVLFVLMSLKASWVLGAPYLFWHDDFFQVGVMALLAVGLLLEEWAFVAVLLDTDENNPINLSAPGEHHSRISLIAAVKDYLGIEKISESSPLPEQSEMDLPANLVVASAAGGMTDLSEEDQARIFSLVREIHSVGTYTLAFLFGFCSAYVYQWQNENLIAFSSIGLIGYGLNGIDFLGPMLIGLSLTLMVYLMFLVRRSILYFSDPLIEYCQTAHRALYRVPGIGKTVADWLFHEIIRADSIFRSFHLIAFVKNLIASVFVLFFSLVYWSGYRGSTDPSVALIVCVVLSGALGIYGWMVFQRRRLRYEFVIGLILILLVVSVLQFAKLPRPARLANSNEAGALPENPDQALAKVRTEANLQQIEREIWHQNLNQATAEEIQTEPVRTERGLLNRWKQVANQSYLDSSGQTVASTAKPVMVLVSNTGGGIKAQVWSTVVLSAVENLLSRPDSDGNFVHFPRHVRLISGASGGMVGAGYWVATLRDDIHWHQADNQSPRALFHADQLAGKQNTKASQQPVWLTTEATVSQMARDCLSRVAREGFFNDLLGIPLRLFNVPLPTRGEALEDALTHHGPAFATLLKDFRERENQGLLPTLIYTPTTANDGRRFLITNQPLEYLFYSRFSKAPVSDQPQTAGLDSKQIPWSQDTESNAIYSWRLNYPHSNMTLATAARLSANFPIVVDSPFLPFAQPENRVRVMDAGYTDNHGIYPLAAWLNSNHLWIKENTSGVVLIQISASSLPRTDNSNPRGSMAPEILGFVTTSFNKTLFHADRLLQQAASRLNQDDEDFFKVVSFAYDGEASLSWYLNKVERLLLTYPFLSDRQAEKLLPKQLRDSNLGRFDAIPRDLITLDSKDITESELAAGARRFRIDDFVKAERLRAKMGRQLQRLENWWQQRRALDSSE